MVNYRNDKGGTQLMKHIDPRTFTASRAWGALDIANLNGTTVRLHWTDQPYKWHVNDGAEIFVVLDGRVDMHHKANGLELTTKLKAGDIFCAGEGDEHYAEPIGAARVLVIEKEGSV
jgi:mannose-6-phosphate isomerase-like protein (cupin superfamily)